MKERGFACASVTRKAENSIKSGHPWVYNTEITGVEGNCENGDLVDVRSPQGKYLGTGFFNET